MFQILYVFKEKWFILFLKNEAQRSQNVKFYYGGNAGIKIAFLFFEIKIY